MEMLVSSLREAMKLVKPAIPRKPVNVKTIKNALLDEGRVIASDLNVMIAVDLPEADMKCLLPHAEVLELLETIPGSLTISVKQIDKKVTLDWGKGEAEFDVDYVSEYPDVPQFEPTAQGSVDGDVLIKALVSVVPFCSNDDTRTSLTGVSLQIGEEDTVVVGADGFRLGYKRLPITMEAAESVIVPVPAIKMLESLWKASPGRTHGGEDLMSHIIGKRMMYLSLNKGYMSTRFGRVTQVSKLIEGTFPDYERILSTVEDLPLTIRFWADELYRALQGVKKVAHANGNIVRLVWSDNVLLIEARSSDTGTVKAKVPVEMEGGDGRVAVNIDYLLNYLKDKDSMVVYGVKDQSSPMQLAYKGFPTVALMPMKVEWGDEVEYQTVNEESETIGDDDETNEDDSEETDGGDETAGEEDEIDKSLDEAMDAAANEMEKKLDEEAEAALAEKEALVGDPEE